MKKAKYVLSFILAVSLLFSSCSQLPSPDSTIKPPLSNTMEKYNKMLGIKLQDFIPADAVLTAPGKPEGAEPVMKKDLDGDGNEEIIITYKTNAIPAEARAVILKKSDGKWINEWDKTHGAYVIEGIQFADLTGDGLPETIFTWGCPPGKFVSYNILSKSGKHIRDIKKDLNFNSILEIQDLPGIYGRDGKLEVVLTEGELKNIHALRWYEGAFIEAEDINVLYRSDYYKRFVEYKIKNTAEKDKTPDFWLNLSEMQLNADLPYEAIKSADKGLYKIKTWDFTPPRPEIWQFDRVKAKALNMIGKPKESLAIIKEILPIIERSDLAMAPGYLLELAEIYTENHDYNAASELIKKYLAYLWVQNDPYYSSFMPEKLQKHIEELKLEDTLNSLIKNSESIRLDKLSEALGKLAVKNNASIELKTSIDSKNQILLCDIIRGKGDTSALLHCVFWAYNGKLFVKTFYSSEGGYNGFDTVYFADALSVLDANGAIYAAGLYKSKGESQNSMLKFIKINKDKCELVYSLNNVKGNSLTDINLSDGVEFIVELNSDPDTLKINNISK